MTGEIRRDVRYAVIPDGVTAQTADHPCRGLPLAHPATLEWRPDDPHAVRLCFGKIVWPFALDLLEVGLDGRAGLWDVRGRAVPGYRLEIILDSPSGQAVLHFSTVAIRAFLEDVAAVWADRHIDDQQLAAWIAEADA